MIANDIAQSHGHRTQEKSVRAKRFVAHHSRSLSSHLHQKKRQILTVGPSAIKNNTSASTVKTQTIQSSPTGSSIYAVSNKPSTVRIVRVDQEEPQYEQYEHEMEYYQESKKKESKKKPQFKLMNRDEFRKEMETHEFETERVIEQPAVRPREDFIFFEDLEIEQAPQPFSSEDEDSINNPFEAQLMLNEDIDVGVSFDDLPDNLPPLEPVKNSISLLMAPSINLMNMSVVEDVEEEKEEVQEAKKSKQPAFIGVLTPGIILPTNKKNNGEQKSTKKRRKQRNKNHTRRNRREQ
ncbi:hypothetical protein PCE1_004564 [Barthelona sp. PCE]